jgi:hypothetical protein
MIIALDTMEKLLPGEKGGEYPAKKKVGGPVKEGIWAECKARERGLGMKV